MKNKRNKLLWISCYALSLTLILGTTLIAWFLFERQRIQEEYTSSRAALQHELDDFATTLRVSMQRSSDALKSLSTIISLEPNMGEERFDELASMLFLGLRNFRSVALAPDLVVSCVYPKRNNENVVGLNYRELPSQLEAVERVVDANDVIIAGPVELVQGGVGLIARDSVFATDPATGKKTFWGITSLAINFEGLLFDAGVQDLGYEIAIRGKDGLGAVGEVFYGEPRLFGQNPINARVELPVGSWWIAAVPKGGWAAPTDVIFKIRLAFFIAGLSLVAMTWLGLRLLQLRIRAVKQLTSAINSIDDGFAYYDADDRLIICNDKYKELYSVSQDLMVPGAFFKDIIRGGIKRGQYPEAQGQEEKWLAERLRAHKSANSVVEQQLDDGRWLKIAESRTPEGGIVGFRVDITELRNAKETAERANLAKSEFLDVMSHELRTPLTVVLGGTPFLCKPELLPAASKLYATLDEQGEAGEAVRRDVDALLGALKTLAGKVDRSAKHLLTLINDVLDFSKIEAGRMDMSLSDLEAFDVVAELLEDFEQKASDKGLELINEVTPQMIHVDEVRLRQVFINIIGNAIKFTDEGSISITSERAGDFVCFHVTDTGCGIPEDSVQQVFEKFTQVDSSSKRKAGGTGLGMAISKRIVEMHGGVISATSVMGQGSTFSFTMPLSGAQGSSDDVTDKSSDSEIAA